MHQYILEPYTTPSSRYHCPQCNDRNRTFVRYINIETGEHLADHVGRCGRENNCGYHYKPGRYFENEGGGWRRECSVWNGGNSKRIFKPKPKRVIQPPPPTAPQPEFYHINPEIVNATFTKYDQNNFVQYLIAQLGLDIADQLVGRYRIGTARHWPGATVFWQIDTEGKVRTGKVMLYDKQTGKRVKKPFNHITWAHSLLMRNAECQMRNENNKETSAIGIPTSDFKTKQCLFGEHLLKEHPGKPVAIVESEKTAIIASAHNQSFVWLASGSISNLNAGICKPLKGRRVTLYPDLGAYDKWQAKALQLQQQIKGTQFTVSNLLERAATDDDRKNGMDICDFL